MRKEEAVVADVTGALDGQLAIDPVGRDEAGSFAPALTSEGYLRILLSDFAGIGGVDGFFIAVTIGSTMTTIRMKG